LRDAHIRTFNDLPPDPVIKVQEYPSIGVGEGSLDETPCFKRESFGTGEVVVDRD
jgi:hypothetical protein